MEHLPYITIIMPVRNEEAYIERSLESVFAQNYPAQKMEILVIDGNSTDNTRNKVTHLSHRFLNYRVTVVNNPNQHMSAGFNLGLHHAQGEIVVMMGGHAEINVNYLSECVKIMKEQHVACVGGAMETVAEGWIGKVIALAMMSQFGVGNVAFRTNPNRVMEVDTVVYAAYKIGIFRQIGCLDEEMIRNQDDEFNYRLREHGEKILFSPTIYSRYYSRPTILLLWRQYYQYGFWKVRVLQKHPRQMSLRQFVPPALVLALLASVLLALFPVSRLLGFLVPLLYLIANLSASVITSAKRGWKYLPLLLIVFAILHLSYGLGFLVGLVKFANRWGDKVGKVPEWKNVPNES